MKIRKIDNDCERATFLIEKRQCDTLSMSDAIDLEIHLTGCYECRIFQKQSELINILCRKILNRSVAEASLDDNFKEALQKRIDTELAND